ncbi:MAG: GGDEF domain-containing protein [Clostridia bacterium]|nr:GGDEF domain-containing protein [Clostridia bacterium]
MRRSIVAEIAGAEPAEVARALCYAAARATGAPGAALYVWEDNRWRLRARVGEAGQDGVAADIAAVIAGGPALTAQVWGARVALVLASPGELSPALEADLTDGARWAAAAEAYRCAVASRDPHVDPVTGLPNREAFAARLAQEVARATRAGRPLALACFALRGLARAAAEVPEAEPRFARALVAATREGDVVFRLGPEEFAVVLPGADADGAGRMAVRALLRLREAAGAGPAVRASAGAADVPGDAHDAPGLRAAAQHALYLAELAGGDCVRLAGLPGPVAVEEESR